MGFSIGEDIGPLGGLLIGFLLVAAGIVAIWFFSLVKRAHDDVVDDDGDRDGPIV